MNLEKIGWNDYFQQKFEEYKIEKCKSKNYYKNKDFFIARVSAQFKNHYYIISERGEEEPVLRKVFLNEVAQRAELPSVGDWVVLINADNSDVRMIDGILPRYSKLGRISAGTPGAFNINNAKNQYSKLDKGEQILCANVNIAFIATSLNKDFNLRRLERYLSMIWNGGVEPIILLTKSDLCTEEEIAQKLSQISTIAFSIHTHIISSIQETGLCELEKYWSSNKTMVIIGSSGVGKSTLINKIIGYDKMKVKDITNYKDKGQHTTTHKELIILDQGGIIIDTPGMRELQLSSDEDSLNYVFNDIIEEIEQLSKNCKFRNCQHISEPNCAVKEALESGSLSKERWNSYKKLLREIKFNETKAMIKDTGRLSLKKMKKHI